MRLIEKIRIQQGIIARARDAAAAGKTMEQFQAEEFANAPEGNFAVWLELFLMILPIIMALLNR
jgi:hypothetical protein